MLWKQAGVGEGRKAAPEHVKQDVGRSREGSLGKAEGASRQEGPCSSPVFREEAGRVRLSQKELQHWKKNHSVGRKTGPTP